MQQKNSARRIALCGVFGAFSLVLMLMGSMLPFSTFLAPALSGILLVPIAIELGAGSAWLAYCAIALLSFFVVPEKEMSLIYIFFLGYYPILKSKLDSFHSKVVQWCTKFALFNAAVLVMYGLVIFLFPIAAIVSEFEQMGLAFAGLLLVAGNGTFVIYDIALNRFNFMYRNIWRPRLMKLH